MRTLILCGQFFKRSDIYSRMSQVSVFQCVKMSHIHKQNLIAVTQLSSTNNKEENFNACKSLIENAASAGAKMIFLPEGFDFLGQNKKETLELAEPIDGPLINQYQEMAKSCNIWLSLGGFHEKESDTLIRNSHLIIDNEGELISVYHKIHMFDINIPDKNLRLMESDTILKGNKIVPPVSTPIGSIGLSICYDLRFPELSLIYTQMGSQILTFPSAFTFTTGSMHWEILLRNRAIENQCYVIAAAQTGRHNQKRTSWGHAMVVDPLGTVIAQCSEGVGSALAMIDLDYIEDVRKDMPVQQHKRNDLYPIIAPLQVTSPCTSPKNYMFGQVSVPSKAVFYKTNLTMAFTNKRCVVPGHVLVAPFRIVQRLNDMTAEEIADLFNVVVHVQNLMERVHKASSSTINVQDGPDAGQTINHVHVHILPRKPGDFLQNDQIYYELQRHDKETNNEAKWRSEEEMIEEANSLKKCLENKM